MRHLDIEIYSLCSSERKRYSPFLAFNKSIILNSILLLQFCTFIARKYTQQRVKQNIFLFDYAGIRLHMNQM